MGAAYINSLRDTAILQALTDAVALALARQAITVNIPTDTESRELQQQQTRSLRRLVMGAEMMLEDEIPEPDD
jgi:hypothetical protein